MVCAKCQKAGETCKKLAKVHKMCYIILNARRNSQEGWQKMQQEAPEAGAGRGRMRSSKESGRRAGDRPPVCKGVTAAAIWRAGKSLSK